MLLSVVANNPAYLAGLSPRRMERIRRMNHLRSEALQQPVDPLNLLPSFGNILVCQVGRYLAAQQGRCVVLLGREPKLIPLRILRL